MKQAGALGRVVLVGLMWLPPAGFAQSAKASATQDWAELALMECLETNYAALNALDRSKTKDFSFFKYGIAKNESWSPDALSKVTAWTKSQTGHFHQENAPMKAESVDKPVNVVFYRCMQFYKSRELRAFIQREVLPLQ
jgi:hypothetical protein